VSLVSLPPVIPGVYARAHTGDAKPTGRDSRNSHSPTYAARWPDTLPALGPRTVGPFDRCSRCETWSWVRFRGVVFCLPCAWSVTEHSDACDCRQCLAGSNDSGWPS
jgi:hypothetical protein